MASVEKRESLNSISETLDFFANFKTIDEDKDSDEESFHLPMLDCEDDVHSNGKELQNGETEEEILNKFESSGTPDIVDPKIEESILADDDDINNITLKNENEDNLPNETTKSIQSNIEENEEEKDASIKPTEDKNENTLSNMEENKTENHSEDDTETCDNNEINVENSDKNKVNENNKNVVHLDESKIEIDKENQAEDREEVDNRESLENKESIDNEEPVDIKKSVANNESDDNHQVSINIDESFEKSSDPINSESNMDTIKKSNNDVDNNSVNQNLEQVAMETDNDILKVNEEDTTLNMDIETEAALETEKTEGNVENKDETDLNKDVKMETVKETEDSPAIENKNNENSVEDLNLHDISESPEIKCDKDNKIVINESLNMENSKEGDNQQNLNDPMDGISDKKSIDKGESSNKIDNLEEKSSELNKENVNEEITEESKSANPEDDNTKINSINKDDNLECDDLLDISVIRDVDEDNANAVAEVNDIQGSDKSDNDDQDEDKADNDIEESEADQDDNLISSDKDDHMDFEDGTSSNLCIEDSSTNDNLTSENTSDSVSKISEYNNDKTDTEVSKSVLNENSSSNQKAENDNLTTELPEESTDSQELDKCMVGEVEIDKKEQNLHGKRSLDEDQSCLSVKKPKLSDSVNDTTIKDESKDEIKTLITFEQYMQSKTLKKKLTRSDLEQFCIQKVCEVIMHRTEIGELHQTIKKNEQLIDTLRKDIQQLTKQARDLDIVHRKLMTELKAQNGNKKPLVPLKITRSVGLQVKLSSSADQNVRKKQTPSSTPNRNTPTTPVNRTRNITPNNNSVVRQVAASPRKPASAAVPQPSAPPTPILTQVLQTPARTTQQTTVNRPIKPKPAESPNTNKSTGQGSAGVIDLTDEDDRASKTVTPVKILNKSIPLIGQPKLGTNVQLKSGKIANQKIANKVLNGPTKGGGTPVKGVQASTKASPVRTVTTLPQGVRLTPQQVKNGIAIPASVVTSNSPGATQLMYVVQPSQLVTTTAGGQQKAVLLNFQPGNSILTSTINGSAVSVIPTKTTNTVQLKTVTTPTRKHPAPLPSPPFVPINTMLKPVLPKPHLSIRKTDTGIILQWRMPYNLDHYESIASYQLYAYQETNAPPSTDMWRKVGDVKALALPMACTLTQFADKNKYYFAVRSIDVHKRIGAFSDPEEISL